MQVLLQLLTGSTADRLSPILRFIELLGRATFEGRGEHMMNLVCRDASIDAPISVWVEWTRQGWTSIIAQGIVSDDQMMFANRGLGVWTQASPPVQLFFSSTHVWRGSYFDRRVEHDEENLKRLIMKELSGQFP